MTYRWTDDPRDPCPLCVHWDEPDPTDSSNFENAVPMLPSGPVDRVCRFVHDSCEAAVMRYVAETSA